MSIYSTIYWHETTGSMVHVARTMHDDDVLHIEVGGNGAADLPRHEIEVLTGVLEEWVKNRAEVTP